MKKGREIQINPVDTPHRGLRRSIRGADGKPESPELNLRSIQE